jgi:hypothetical protein
MRKFMITFTHVEGGWERLSADQKRRHQQDLADFTSALASEKKSRLVFLGPPADARTVRLGADGRYDVSEGTVAKSPEFAGGYYLIEAETLEEAVEWAKRGRFMPGANEVREISGG